MSTHRNIAFAALAFVMAAPALALADTTPKQGMVVAVGPQQALERFVREPNLDRSGNDIKSIKLMPRETVADCERRCLETPGCLAYTFVKRSTTVPLPICWIKDTVPQGYESSCCTSGVLK